jgi:type IV secretory pathway VirB9-like protein
MKPTLSVLCRLSLFLLSLLTCGPLAGGDREARTVHYSRKDIIELRCQVRVSTAIVLPTNEKILDFTTGDKEYWIVNGAENFCYVHPAKPGISSNLNLICSSGNVYSFLLTEVSATPNSERPVDYKVFVEPKEDSLVSSINSPNPRFVPAEEIAQYKKQITLLQEQVTLAETQANQSKEKEVSEYRSKYPVSLRFQYQFKSQEPFEVTAIFHDGTFTYIHSNAREKPAIYEIKDSKPNLINFQLENNCYIVPKVIDRGYLQVGKKKMGFRRRGV